MHRYLKPKTDEEITTALANVDDYHLVHAYTHSQSGSALKSLIMEEMHRRISENQEFLVPEQIA